MVVCGVRRHSPPTTINRRDPSEMPANHSRACSKEGSEASEQIYLVLIFPCAQSELFAWQLLMRRAFHSVVVMGVLCKK